MLTQLIALLRLLWFYERWLYSMRQKYWCQILLQVDKIYLKWYMTEFNKFSIYSNIYLFIIHSKYLKFLYLFQYTLKISDYRPSHSFKNVRLVANECKKQWVYLSIIIHKSNISGYTTFFLLNGVPSSKFVQVFLNHHVYSVNHKHHF